MNTVSHAQELCSPGEDVRKSRDRVRHRLYLASFLLALFVPLIPHMCRSLHAEFLVASAPAAAISWILFAGRSESKLLDRIVVIFVVTFTTMILVWNLADVLPW
ncbi:MAG: hypothetical protein HYY18_00695 [Planctomycetes bacterium]|nr:hypothetical protein [Planctomycetota bacterium]